LFAPTPTPAQNHTAAFGSLDTVTFSGVGGTLRIDPTNVRVIAYTGGSGNAPAYGTTITANNGTTGVFLGAWTNWLSEPITPGSAIGATGFIKLGSVSSVGNFNAGAHSPALPPHARAPTCRAGLKCAAPIPRPSPCPA
jgi:hypothetical protein